MKFKSLSNLLNFIFTFSQDEIPKIPSHQRKLHSQTSFRRKKTSEILIRVDRERVAIRLIMFSLYLNLTPPRLMRRPRFYVL